jgi:Flp pilus assembly protein CpaB
MTYRMRNIALAIALTLTAALLTTFYVSNYKRSVQASEANVRVYVATRDIPAGLTGSSVAKRHLLEPRDVARRTVVPGAISNPEEISRLVVTDPVYSGEQVSTRRFGSAAERGLRGALTGTMRALEVPGEAPQLLAGTLKAGDHVDLIANLSVNQGDHATRIVLRDIDVLRAPDATSVDARAGISATVLLAIRDTQVQRLFFVLKNADWSLSLRPGTDAANGRDVVETTNSVVSGRSAR